MSYCTLADIEKKRIPTDTLIQLTDDENLAVINEDIVNSCILDANILVEGYLRGRYPLPLDPIPELISIIVADLAVYGLYAIKPQFEVPKTIIERRTTALALLTRIQDGKTKLYDDAVAPVINAASVSFSSSERVCSRDLLSGF
ncbi:MAG: DUF1320 domain-containing protein [Deltaproteobacteria bacterium]